MQLSYDEMPDVRDFLETVKRSRDVFERNRDIYVTRAPGRLDVMGGIADYSGSLVMEMPIAEATFAALQTDDARFLKITSLGGDAANRSHFFEMHLAEFELESGGPISYAAANERFAHDPTNRWAAYIAGAFLVLMRERGVRFDVGARILIDSQVPEGKGVSSSAAIEVAVMTAVSAAFEIDLDVRESAILCQKVENLVVGAPCGIMDQMSSMSGERDRLLSILCQPAEIQGSLPVPEELAFWGIDSGVRHSVGALDYGSVRTGAFMGYRMIAEAAGLQIEKTERPGVVDIVDPEWHGWLANITPAEFENEYASRLPREMSGSEFLGRYQGITDTVTRVVPERTYAVFHPTAHPVYENARVRHFADLLNGASSADYAAAMGDLMYASHESYTACGIGSDGTDLLVDLVERSDRLHGAKITGGGSGGTVAVLGEKGAGDEIVRIAREYESLTNRRPYVFSGSSMGASAFGNLKIRMRLEDQTAP